MAREVVFDRRVLLGNKKGQIRFTGWNVVHTIVGVGFEPVSVDMAGPEKNCSKKQLNDIVNRTDGLQFVEDASSGLVHKGDECWLVGGMTTFRNQDFADPINDL